MTRIFLVAFIFGFFCGHILNSKADDPIRTSSVSTSRVSKKVKKPQVHAPSEDRFLVGMTGNAGGASLNNPSDPTMKTSGSFLESMVNVSMETKTFVYTLGIGVFSSSLNGSRDASSTSSGSGLSLMNYSMSTAGEVGQIAIHYRLTDEIEAGVFSQILFGSDTAFDPNLFQSGNSLTLLGGVEALYGFDFLNLRWKAGGRFLESLAGLDDRTLYAYQATVEAMIPL